MTESTPTIVIVPGLRDHVDEHWQSLLAAELADRFDVRTVPPVEREKFSLDARVAALAEVVSHIGGPIMLVAHSAGVLIAVHWAARSSRPIAGALLATPPDLTLPMHPPHPTSEQIEAGGWNPIPTEPLRFPSIVVASRNDPLATFDTVAGYASAWGSRLVDAGDVGHLNPAAGYGRWAEATELVDAVLESGSVSAS